MNRIVLALTLLVPLACAGPGSGDGEADTGTDGGTETGGTETGGDGDGDCPQADDFLDVSMGSPGDGYPAPQLMVECVDDKVVVDGNGIPNFEFDQVTPNALQEQNHHWELPRNPTPAASPGAIPLGGPVAVAVNGLPIFGPTEAPMDGFRDPILDQLLDYCDGHTAPGGVYHFHARPDCLFTDLEGNASLVVAYGFDGYPILAPFACEDEACSAITQLESSWQPIADQFDAMGNPLYDSTPEGAWDIFEYVEGSGDLDECNGRELAGGGYAYYATDGFPYFMGCYRGEVPG